jgi:hypothetical protein
MTRRKGLVLDANILLRAVFGQRVSELLEAVEGAVTFYSPDVCFDDARKYIPDVSARRRIDPLPVAEQRARDLLLLTITSVEER